MNSDAHIRFDILFNKLFSICDKEEKEFLLLAHPRLWTMWQAEEDMQGLMKQFEAPAPSLKLVRQEEAP